ncbi:hypothetical protein SAMN05421849_0485 [Pontibaca methylaminivorans]|uniref:Uncharacterized protein n=2 Tax=Pontibaca methylaminivorans TaxID=515897 RepID=A0A1R3WEM4_9RHOB|nr:hypothetical protein SAMN05421849_0485 [Pontibaca methylaminivorans]
MRGIIAIIIAVIVIGGGIYWYQTQQGTDSVIETTEPEATTDEPGLIDDTGDADALENDEIDTGSDLDDADTAPADDAAADDVTSSAGTEPEDVESTDDVTTDTDTIDTDTVETDTVDTEDTDTGATDDAVDADEDAAMTEEGFDYDQVIQTIDDSDLDEARKESLKSAVTAARDNPVALNAVLSEIRAAVAR